MQITIQPVLFQAGKDIISISEEVLSEEFNASVSTASTFKEMPLQLFDKQRKQWKSDEILQWLLDKHKPTRITTKILATCDFDAYYHGIV
jgi:hypothetical protein